MAVLLVPEIAGLVRRGEERKGRVRVHERGSFNVYGAFCGKEGGGSRRRLVL